MLHKIMTSPSRTLAMVAILALSGACSTMDGLNPARTADQPAAPAVDRDTTVALLMANTIQTLQRLVQSAPAEQAEIIASAKAGYERAPLGSAQLRYALALAIPGHAGRDPERARSLLRELAAQPEALAPVERALTLIEVAQLDRELGLKSDNERLQADSQRGDRERLTVANRRLQNEIEESAKLRKQLEEAKAKLDAIAKIERNLTERQSATEGRKP
jgi:hypothetical protein